MDSDQFHAPPTTTAGLAAYFHRYGRSADTSDIELIHFTSAEDIPGWLSLWQSEALPAAKQALQQGFQPVFGFSCYTWNVAEFLELVASLKALLPGALAVAGGPHVQQARDFLGSDPFDLIVLGEGEETFQELLDAQDQSAWSEISGLAFLAGGQLVETPPRPRCQDLDRFPSPLDDLPLTDAMGEPLYDAISYETSRGCPFRCAFCEWGTGAIGGRMYQWSMERIRRDWTRIAEAGIKDLWLADSNFGALKQDLAKAQLIVELKNQTGYPRSFATSWSKKHSRQVQEIALLLHRNQLLPHYQLALQTLTPEALRLSNRDNMSSNQYEPIAKRMSEEGVPIAAELIWGLPGDTLPDFESNLDRLLSTFPNINIFGYTLLPGTEFYQRREEFRIETIPVAGYGKAKGEYVVGSLSFDREQGEEGYFLITAHILLIHGHIMPLTARYLALQGDVPVSALLRAILRDLIAEFGSGIANFDAAQRMQVYESRNDLYLAALSQLPRLFELIRLRLKDWLTGVDTRQEIQHHALKVLLLDQALCPRTGSEALETLSPGFDMAAIFQALSAMELPGPAAFASNDQRLSLHHPGGVGEILSDADGGSWLRGNITAMAPENIAIAVV
jgi:radical SAM superfamily enzyme YgiQ (UPF0313 family)